MQIMVMYNLVWRVSKRSGELKKGALPGIIDTELHVGKPLGFVHGPHKDHAIAKDAALQQP